MERAANGFRAFARHAFLGMIGIGGGLLGSAASAGINELTSLGPRSGSGGGSASLLTLFALAALLVANARLNNRGQTLA